jgi:hypothetical protein
VIQTLQRICALPAVTDTELPFSCLAARCLQKLRAYCTRPATDLRANIGLCPSGNDKSADAALDGAIGVPDLKSKERRVTDAPRH